MHRALLIRVAGLVLLAVSFVVLGDTAGKLLTGAGVHPFFVAWTRFLIGALVLLPVSGLRREELKQLTNWRLALRAALIALAVCAILTGLKTEPIANVFGAFFIGPVVAFGLAAVLLGERLTWARGWLLALGFLGVILVVKPGFGASPGSGFALLAGALYGGYLVTTRWLAVLARPRLLLLSQLVIGAALLTPLGLSVAWPGWSLNMVLLVLASALSSAIGNYLLVLANRIAPASIISPLIYLQLFPATVLGLLVFGDWPDVIALTGLALVAFSGLATLFLAQRGR